jgi:preprotein translocase subunit SecA
LIARDMAELGWVKVGRKLLRLLVRHKAPPRAVMVKGKPAMVDPSQWNPEANLTINTGLGTGSRDRDAMMLGQVLQQQIAYTDRIGQVFPEKALEMLPFIHNTLTRFAESTGLKNPELYWPEIDPKEIDQGKAILAQRASQPDPQLQIAQIKANAETSKAQADAQLRLVEAQATERQSQLEAQLASTQLQLKQLEISTSAQLEKWKAELMAAAGIAEAQAKAGFEQQASVLEAGLESALGFQQHQQNIELAQVNAALTPQPQAPNGATP